MTQDIKLGSRAKDIVTGFTGIVTARIEYLNGCVQYLLKPPVDSDGKMVESEWFDVQRVEVVDEGINKKIEVKKTGGPTPAGTPRAYRG